MKNFKWFNVVGFMISTPLVILGVITNHWLSAIVN